MNEVIITNKERIAPVHTQEHEPYEYYKHVVTAMADRHLVNVSIYEIPPGKANYPYHHHTANEEIFFIISGRGLLRTPGGERTLMPGDIAVFPPSERGAHKLTNVSDMEALVYLDIDTNRIPDVIFYPDSEKIGIKVGYDLNNRLFYDSSVDYYAGE
jgi:uncharacterized cupin superfamily protein